jgi:prepilin-type N-terminal cleavage/methylation domain-containing protein
MTEWGFLLEPDGRIENIQSRAPRFYACWQWGPLVGPGHNFERSRDMKNSKQAGFTLIELAVVLAAISALAATFLPAVQ